MAEQEEDRSTRDARVAKMIAQGNAPVKREYWVTIEEGETTEWARRQGDDSSPTHKAKRTRGMNRRRPIHREERKLCPHFVRGSCSYGEDCKFGHDVEAFLASKPPDLSDHCVIHETYGTCPFGITCRYASGHAQEVQEGKSLAYPDERNNLSRELQKALRQRTYAWERITDAEEPHTSYRESRVRPTEKPHVDFSGKLCLSPLTTLGNLPFRRVCKQFGADITCGEMAMASNLLQGQQSEWALLRRHPSEQVFGIQIAGAHADQMGRLCEVLDREMAVDFVDLNCGCPIDLICNKGAGAALLDRARRLEAIVRTASGVLSRPFTVKLRMGKDEKSPTAHQIMPHLKDWGASAVTLHGRSKQQRYTKAANWEYIRMCAGLTDLPVIGNGDVFSHEEYLQNMDGSNVDAVMIGRGALVKPWIFTEITERRHWDISSSERLEILKDFVKYGLEHWGSDQKGVEDTRRFLLEWLSFLHRYVPVGLLEVLPPRINLRPPAFLGRDDLETLMGKSDAASWIQISEMLLGKAPDGFLFVPKHKSNASTTAQG